MRGAGCVGSQERDGVFPGRSQSFRYQRRQWATAVQDEGGWNKTAEQVAERFMAKWITAKKIRAGLRHAVVCPNVTGRTKNRIAQIKRMFGLVCSPKLISHKWREHVSSGRLVYRCHIFFLWYFRLQAFIKATAFNRSSIRMRPDSHIQLPNNCLRNFYLCCLLLCFSSDVAFSEFFVPLLFSLCMENTCRQPHPVT